MWSSSAARNGVGVLLMISICTAMVAVGLNLAGVALLPAQRAAASPPPPEARPLVWFAMKPQLRRYAGGSLDVVGTVRVSPPEHATPIPTSELVIVQVRQMPGGLFHTTEVATDSLRAADFSVRLDERSPWTALLVTAYLRDAPAAHSEEVTLTLPLVWPEVDVTTAVFTSGFLTRELQPLQITGALMVVPRLALRLTEARRHQTRLYVEQPIVAMSRAVLPVPTVPVPATGSSRLGLGPLEVGLKGSYRYVAGSIAVRGLGSTTTVPQIRTAATPGTLAISSEFVSLETQLHAEASAGTATFFGSAISSTPLRRRLGESVLAHGGQTFHLTSGLGGTSGDRRAKALVWIAYTRHGGIRLDRDRAPVATSVIDRQVGLIIQRQRNSHAQSTVSLSVGGLGRRVSGRYIAVAVTISTRLGWSGS
jgi:hypothetical protein